MTSVRILMRPGACSRAARAAVLMLPLFSSACKVGPDFRPPAAPSMSAFIAPGEMNVPVSGPVQVPEQSLMLGGRVTGAWWTLFRSPDLDGVMKQAIEGSPTLESARARLIEAREALVATSSTLYPQVDVGTSAAREKVSATEFGLPPSAFPLPPNFNLLQVGGTAQYTLDLFGGARRQIERQSALADYDLDQLDAAYLTLTGNTATQAVEIAATEAQLKAVSDILEIDRENLDLVRRERRAGTVPDSDVITAESQLAQDETLQPGLEQRLSVAKHAVAVLLGRAPGDWLAPDFDLAALTLPGQLPVSLPSELVHRRPDIQAAEAQLHAASAQIGVATAQLYPTVALSAGLASSALSGGQLFDPSGLVWSVAAGLTQPLFDGGLRRAEKRAALAEFKAAAADYQETVLTAFGQVADILQALAHDSQLLAAEQHAHDMAFEALRLQRISYAKGGTGLINLLDAQRQYEQARLGLVRAQGQRFRDSIQLFVAMGGGWWDANLAATASATAPIVSDQKP
jgi:NodT family efflux transporter outer membrane factor (OMF) lipoprotein